MSAATDQQRQKGTALLAVHSEMCANLWFVKETAQHTHL